MNKFPMFSGAVPVDDKGLMTALRDTDFARKAVAEHETHVVASRKTIVTKLAKMDADSEGRYPKQQAELRLLVEKSREAENAYRRASDRAFEFQAKMSAEWSVHGNEIARLESQLAETASPLIGPFILDMQLMWENCLKQHEVRHATVTVNIIGQKTVSSKSNKSAIFARQEAIRDAIKAAESMRLEPDQASVPERLQQLRNALPAIG